MARQNVWRVYINPFDDQGVYSGWVEVTKDVVFDQMGSISENLDNTDYDIGIFRLGAFALSLKNEDGKYSDVDNVKSLFHYRRTGTQVKVTWEVEAEGGPICGMAEAGNSWLSEEQEVFKGILNDDSTSQDVDSNQIKFSAIGRETLFQNEIVQTGSVSNGDLFSEALYTILNQQVVTLLLGVAAENINCANDQEIDDASKLEGKTILEAINLLLFASNSILYISDDTINVAPRDASDDVLGTFYGQGSSLGRENIASIKNVKNGIAKVFNYLIWSDTLTSVQDDTSTGLYGVQKKDISFDFITDNTKRRSIMQAIVDEFKYPEQEFDLSTPIDFNNVGLKLLNKCSIDYPTVYIPNDNPPAICGIALCGNWYTPKALWDLTINPLDDYKIINRSIDIKNSMMKFRMRKVS